MSRVSLWALLLLLVSVAAAPKARAQASGSTEPTVIGSVSDESLKVGASQSVDLSQVFGLPGVTGTVVRFTTVLGSFNVEVYDQIAPGTVSNFLGYVTMGAYNNTLINRSVPGFVEQGGTYTVSGSNLTTVPSHGMIKNEFHVSNTAGTIAMAKLATGPDTASTTWFFNLTDNSSNLDNQNGGFTAFGRVIGSGMSVVQQMASEPVYDASTLLGSADFSALPLINYTGSLTTSNLVLMPSVAVVPVLPTTSSSASVMTFVTASSNPAAATASLSGSALTVTANQVGTSAITVQATDTNGNSAVASFIVTVTAAAQAPAIQQGPVAQTVAAGSTVVFAVAATGTPAPNYQWQLNGQNVAGATNARLVVANAASGTAGNYTCVVSNSVGTATSGAASLALSSTGDVGRLLNLSVLSTAGGGQTLSVGFVSGGGTVGAKENLLVRASGPALGAFGISDFLPDPEFTLYSGPTTIVTSNDNWSSDSSNASAVTAADVATGAFALTAGSLDAALAASLTGGSYSVAISGNGTSSGQTIAEVYDNTPAGTFSAGSQRLINFSCLNTVSGSGKLTAGFVIGGSTSKTVLVRATGPALANLGVTGVMPDPQIQLFNKASQQIAANAGWGGDPQIKPVSDAVSAFTLTDPNSKDSVVLVTLPPGSYSAQASSVSGAAGQVLVEVYAVP